MSMPDLIPILRQAELLKRDSDYLRAKQERTEASWSRLKIIKQTAIWKEFIELDDWVGDAITKRNFKDKQKFMHWRELQIGITDYVASAFTFPWVFKAIEDAGIIGWQKHYENK